MTPRLIVSLTAIGTCLAVSAPASAQSLFDREPVSDLMLNAMRGGQTPIAPQFYRLQDGISRDAFRILSGNANIAMDDWWAQSGASLIADSLSRQR